MMGREALIASRPMDACECGLCAVCNCWLKRPDWDQQQGRPSEEDLCDHSYAGDDGDVGRCYCGLQQYPKGGPNA